MTSERLLHVLATDPETAQALVREEHWGPGSSVVWVSDPIAMLTLGLPAGVKLYEVRVVFRWSVA